MYAQSEDIKKMDLKECRKALRNFKRKFDEAEDMMSFAESQVYKCESLIEEVKERIIMLKQKEKK